MSISNDLRQAVLQAAIQGKLTKQLPEDGNAKDLLEQIKAEKAKLVEEGKLKKEKSLPEIMEDEKPFDIPENWEWCRLDDLVKKNIKRGKSPTYAVQGSVLVFAQKCNVKTGGINLELAQYLDESKLLKYPDKEFMEDEDIVVNSTGRGTLGRVGLFTKTVNAKSIRVVPDSHVTVIRGIKGVCRRYLYYFLKNHQKNLESMGDGSTNQTELKPLLLRMTIIPLPPHSEQKRIVAKVEELLAKIDYLEKTEKELEALKKAFPADMKAALLQAAMQGKLTEQLPEDGNAKDLLEQIKAEKAKLVKEEKLKKEKPLPEITEDEKPFDIPENWEWVRLGEVGMSLTGNTPSTMKLEYYNGDIPFVGPGDISINSDINYDTSKKLTATGAEFARIVGNETLLQVCIGGSIGKVCLVERTVAFNQQINALKTIKVLPRYVFCVMKSQMFLDGMFEKSTGTATPIINRTSWEQLLLPLPPLAEQKRIVEKLERLLPLCDGLK